MGHINFTMIRFHLTASGGEDVDEDLLNDLIAVQTTVRQHFGWDYQDDLTSAICMSQMMNSATPFEVEGWSPNNRVKSLNSLKQVLLSAKNVAVVGASVCKSDIDELISEDSVIIAADGSVGAVIGLPNLVCVVTDFDGNPHLDFAANSDVVFVAHAHGDNFERWQKSLAEWSHLEHPPKLILTHQVNESIEGMENFGGFTDGDRAVCLVLALGVHRHNISLVGFSTTSIGEWSGQTNPVRKLEKLEWMVKILQMLELSEQVETNAS